MKKIPLIIFLFFGLLSSCAESKEPEVKLKPKKVQKKMSKYTNSLINESSPYLLQHANNPVNWYPWGQEALDKAKKENKLVLISIGYAACHWCHVMEHESFEDVEVAKYMNENYIAIKIDREERPDIDQVYMNAVQLLTGRGGWPLNCIALPDGRPIYGGTYFPKAKWLDMLTKVNHFAKNSPQEAEKQADLLINGIKSSENIYENTDKALFEINDLDKIYQNWEPNIDFINGGGKRVPKFPLPVSYQFLLNYNYFTNNKRSLEAVKTTLDKMANGGIYDQIGGGFARYSTDAIWKVPHFEKMLYDNSQLVSLYSIAYQKFKDENYRNIIDETLSFVERELTSEFGGFYSSLDADSEGEEGKFYIWTKAEVEAILGNDSNIIIDYYNVSDKGNWENSSNILLKSNNEIEILDKYQITQEKLDQTIILAKEKLLNAREKKIRPALDDKILTSWNALMLKGYIDAYQSLGNQKYLDIALKNAEFINSKVKQFDNRLDRNYKNSKSSINAFLDDYAFTIEAFISLYQATFEEKWLKIALDLTNYTIKHYYDENSKMFFYTSDIDPDLIARKMELSDNVIPASNSQMAKNLFILGKYFNNIEHISKSKQMLNNIKSYVIDNGPYYSNWAILMSWFINDPYEVAIVGPEFEQIRKDFDNYYLPNVILLGGKNEGTLPLLEGKVTKGKTTIYVCQNKVCQLPVSNVKDAIKQILK